jgi:hypothetical protein
MGDERVWEAELLPPEDLLEAAESQPVRVGLTDDRLQLDTAGGAIGLPLNEVISVEEEMSPANGQVIVVTMQDGFLLHLRVSEVFVAAFLERLAQSIDRTGAPTTDSPLASAPPTPVSPSSAVEPPAFRPSPVSGVSPQGLADSGMPATSPNAGPNDVATKEKRPLARILAFAAVALLVVGLVGATFTFRSKYEASSDLADRNAAELEETSAVLEKTTADLATMTSERDDQTQRVTELSNEKAQVQDERNASQELARLGAVSAQEMQDCRNQLLDVMSAMLDSSVYVASAMLDAVVPVCQSANTSVAAFADAAG